MRKRLLWRRSATALGIYGSTALGILGSIVVLRILGPTSAGRFSLAIGTAAFFQLLLELTGDEALVKYGFRYAEQEDWGASTGSCGSPSGSRRRRRSRRR